MSGLLRDWLLDPTALLFLSSVVLGLWLFRGVRIRARHRAYKEAGSNSSDQKKPGFGSSRIWSVLAVVVWLGFYALCTSPVAVNALIAMREQPYVAMEECGVGSHLILLGGGVDSRVQTAQDFYRMQPATFVRASVASTLAQAEPELRIIVAGGALRDIAEADVIGGYLESLGLSDKRLMLESNSANTRENAVNVSRILANEEVTGPVRLVTSALHMHRALNTFERVFDDTDLVLCAVATDMQGLLNPAAYAWMPQTTTLVKFDLLLHEIVALVVYRLRGWI